MHKFYQIFIIVVFSLWISPIAQGYSEQVQAVRSDGTLEMANGERLVLAGIQVPPETVRLLSSFLTSRNILIQNAPSKSSDFVPKGVKHAYVFMNMKEIDMKELSHSRPVDQLVMINELLLELGAARVDEGYPCDQSEHFMEIQNVAREIGRGIWSYESVDFENGGLVS